MATRQHALIDATIAIKINDNSDMVQRRGDGMDSATGQFADGAIGLVLRRAARKSSETGPRKLCPTSINKGQHVCKPAQVSDTIFQSDVTGRHGSEPVVQWK